MLLDNKNTIKVRLISIDCRERKQPYSAVATKFLSDHIFGNRVKVVVDSKDRYGRSLGWVYYDDKNLNKELLKAGLAWHYNSFFYCFLPVKVTVAPFQSKVQLKVLSLILKPLRKWGSS